jgi:hypothetical protein
MPGHLTWLLVPRLAFLAVAALRIVTIADAQQPETAAITGWVVDARSLTPIPGAVVALKGGGRPPISVDSMGRFVQTGLASGSHRLEARAIGYVVGSWMIVLVEGDTVRDLRLALHQREYVLPAVEATADAVSPDRDLREFERRRASGRGVFITRDELEQERPATLADILRTVPGVTTTCERTAGCYIRMLRAPRGCRAEVFVDGFPATLSTPPNTLAGDMVAVEVYRSLGETPTEFLRLNNSCGVVAIWTRTGNTERR